MPQVGEAYIEVEPDLDTFGAKLKAAFKSLGSDVESDGKVTGLRFGNAMRSGIAASLGKGLAIGGLAAAMAGPIATLAADLAGAVVPLTTNALALGQGAIAAKIGLGGMTDAMKAQADAHATLAAGGKLTEAQQAKLKETMGALSQEGRQTVRALAGMNDEWLTMRNAVQTNLLDGMSRTIKDLGATYLPVLTTQLGATATVLNQGARDFASWMSQGAQVSRVNTLMAGLSDILRILLTAVQPLTDAFLNLFVYSLPYAKQIATWIAKGATAFADYVASAEGAKEIKGWFADGLSTLKQLWGTVQQLSALFSDLAASTDTGEVMKALTDTFRLMGEAIVIINNSGLGVTLLNLLVTVGPLLALFGQFLAILNLIIGPIAALVASSTVLQGVIYGLGVAFAVYKIATMAVTAANILLGTSFSIALGPLTLIILGIAALVAALIYAWNHSETFRTVVIAVWNAVKAAVMAVVNWFKTEIPAAWDRVSDATRAVWNGIKSFFSAIWNGISLMISTYVDMWRSIIDAGWAAIKAVVSGAVNGVKAVIGGLASIVGDIRGFFERAHDAVVNVVGTVIAFLGRFPSRVLSAIGNLGSLLYNAGRDLITGFLNGIKDMIGSVVQTAKDMASKVVGGVKGVLQIGSPSKVMEKLGEETGKGFTIGFVNAFADIPAKIEAFTSHVSDLFDDLDTKVDNRINAIARRGGSALDALSQKAKDTFANFQRVYTSMIGEGALAGLGERMTEEGEKLAPTAATILQDLAGQVTNAEVFAQNLLTLKARGLNATALAQLVEAGATQGAAAAQALVDGGKQSIAAVNVHFTELAAAARTASQVGSAAMYQAGVDMGQGMMRGFRDQRLAIEGEMSKIAKAMVRAIRRELKAGSPSQVFADVGSDVALGLVEGMDDERRTVANATASLVPTSANAVAGMTGGVNATGVPSWRVYIGDRDITDIVKVEVADSQDALAREVYMRSR